MSVNTQRIIWVLLILWAAAFVWSLWAIFVTPATGDGFTRGLNRLVDFVKWQVVAGGIAAIIWALGRGFGIGTKARWLSRVPGLTALLLVLAILVMIVIALITDRMAPVPPELPNPKPVAEPVD